MLRKGIGLAQAGRDDKEGVTTQRGAIKRRTLVRAQTERGGHGLEPIGCCNEG